MRQAGIAGTATRARPRAMVAIALTAALCLAGCASQVGGTALTPTSIPRTSTTATAVSTTDIATTSSPETSSSETSSSETSSSERSSTDASSSDNTDSSSSSTSSTSSTGPSAPTGPTIQPEAFAAKMKAANAGLTSAKGSISVVAGAANISGAFGETITAGQVNALDMSMFIAEGTHKVSLRLLIVGGKIYLSGAAVLSSLNVGPKKWALVSTDSKNASLRALAGQLSGYLTSASANQYQQYAAAAKSVVDGGPGKIGTVAVHRYDITVDVAALAKASPASTRASIEALARSGVTTLPTTLWLDSSNRLVQSESTVKVSGVTSKSTFEISAYNVPVTIKAPAAGDVFTG